MRWPRALAAVYPGDVTNQAWSLLFHAASVVQSIPACYNGRHQAHVFCCPRPRW